MTKNELLNDIEDIKSDRVLITDSVDKLDEEIEINCWSISINDKLSKEFSVDELASFLTEVKENRRKQLRQSEFKVALIYYVWVDEQAGQLRYNFINSSHDSLPFRSELSFVATEKEIITDFLTRPFTFHGTTKVFKELIFGLK